MAGGSQKGGDTLGAQRSGLTDVIREERRRDPASAIWADASGGFVRDRACPCNMRNGVQGIHG